MSGVTIYQVAKAAGVSPSTVSNVLNGRDGRMLPATRQRVVKAMSDLGYQPNRAARQLRTGRAHAVGLIVPSVANPFWGAFARDFESAALRHGYNVLLCNSSRDPNRELAYVNELWADGLRGVVLCSSLPSLAHLRDKIQAGLTLVAFDRTAQPDDPPSVLNISIDNVIAARLATDHLLDLGHRRIAFISGDLDTINRRDRYRGFRESLVSAGITADDIVSWSDPEGSVDLDAAELGRRAAVRLLRGDSPPSALVAINDMCALGVCAGVRDAGMRVGRDVSVVGFDDIVLAELASPALTTVRQPLRQMAEQAFSGLLAGIEGDGMPSGSVLTTPELIVRESTSPPQH